MIKNTATISISGRTYARLRDEAKRLGVKKPALIEPRLVAMLDAHDAEQARIAEQFPKRERRTCKRPMVAHSSRSGR